MSIRFNDLKQRIKRQMIILKRKYQKAIIVYIAAKCCFKVDSRQ